MKPEDADSFAFEMFKAAETHGVKVSDTRVVAYFEILAAYDLEEIRDAFKAHARGCRFFPSAAELIEQIEGSLDDHAELAWLEVRKVIRGQAKLQTVMRLDPAITPAVHSVFGSWRDAQQVQTADLPFRRKDFIRCYRTMAKRHRQEASPVLALVAPDTVQQEPVNEHTPKALEPPSTRDELRAMVARVMSRPAPEDRWPKSRPDRIKAQVEALKAKYPDPPSEGV